MSLGVYALSGGDEDKVKETSLGYNLSGARAADAAEEASRSQVAAGREALELLRGDLQPYREFGLEHLGEYNKLFGQGGVDFLQNNPLYQNAVDETSRTLFANRAAQGKLGSGGTAKALGSSLYGVAQDFLNQERNARLSPITIGQNSAAQSGVQGSDILQNVGNAQAAGAVGEANAGAQGASNAVNILGLLAKIYCDRRLKRNIYYKDTVGGIKTYLFQYLWSDNWFIGPMSDEVDQKYVTQANGYDVVDIEGLVNGA